MGQFFFWKSVTVPWDGCMGGDLELLTLFDVANGSFLEPVCGGNCCSSRMSNLFSSWRLQGDGGHSRGILQLLLLRTNFHFSFWLGVELTICFGLAPSRVHGSAFCVTVLDDSGTVESRSPAGNAAVGPTETRESRVHLP